VKAAVSTECFLRSRRLGFRTWRPTDITLALDLWGDPAVTRFISRQGFTDAEIRVRLEREIASQETSGIQYWPIFSLEDGQHIGCCGLRPRQGHPRAPEFGVHIGSNHWRQGYAFEAGSVVIEHAFGTLGFEALFAGHNPHNVASRTLLARLGFAHTHNEFYAPTGLEHPSYLLAKT
jgi:RimJ/RimL family protein N-acetyltransferase